MPHTGTPVEYGVVCDCEPTDRFMDTVQSRLPGVLDSAVLLELDNTLTEFFLTTRSWREIVTLKIKEGQVEYFFNPVDQHAEVAYILALAMGPVPQEYFVPEPGRIILHETPIADDNGKDLSIFLSLTRREGVDSAPHFIYSHYFEVVLDGVLGRMMGTPAKPYTSEKTSIYHMRRNRAGMSRARAEADRGWAQRAPPWMFPRGFMERRKRGGFPISGLSA